MDRKKKKIIIFLNIFLAIFTSYFVSKTYAKYISEIDASDEARVAKWGVNITKTVDLFQESYLDGAVESSNGDKVVAPGTSGEYSFKITGNPEVAYRIRIEVDKENTIDGTALGGKEGQILYTLDKGTKKEISTYNILELMNYVQGCYPASKINEPGTEINSEHTISWEWKFENETKEKSKEKNDEIDTALGEQAITDKNDKDYDTQKKVILSFRIIAEQVAED